MGIYMSAIVQALLWSIMGLGVFISFRMLHFADLTSEASFAVGAVVVVTLITQGMPPIFATVAAMFAGALTGLLTGILMTRFNIPSLLAGIITLTAFYSINLRIMGRANTSLRGFDTLYDMLSLSVTAQRFVVGIVVIVLCIVALAVFFKTDIGQALIATGDNEVMAQSLGIHTRLMKCVALMLSNGLIALSGALVAQDNGFAEVSLGNGTVIIALAAIILGEMLFKNLSLAKRLMSIVVGAILYRLLLVCVLQLGFAPNDFKLVSASLLAFFLAVPQWMQQKRRNA